MNPENEDSFYDFLQSQITDTPLSLNNELSNMGVKFNHRDDFDEIKLLMDEFIDGNNVNRYIVLPGLRGVGKTTILFQAYDYLLNQKNINPEQILYFSCEELNKIELFGVQMSLGSYNNIKEPTEEDYKTVDMLSNPADYVEEEKLEDFYKYLLDETLQ